MGWFALTFTILLLKSIHSLLQMRNHIPKVMQHSFTGRPAHMYLKNNPFNSNQCSYFLLNTIPINKEGKNWWAIITISTVSVWNIADSITVQDALGLDHGYLSGGGHTCDTLPRLTMLTITAWQVDDPRMLVYKGLAQVLKNKPKCKKHRLQTQLNGISMMRICFRNIQGHRIIQVSMTPFPARFHTGTVWCNDVCEWR